MDEFVAHWTRYLKPITGKTHRVAYERALTAVEFDHARRGLLPRDTDDRWFALCLDDEIALARAHGGHQIYRLPLTRRGDTVMLGPILVIRNKKVYSGLGDAYDLETATRLVETLLSPDRY